MDTKIAKDFRNEAMCIRHDINKFLYEILPFLNCSRTLNGHVESQNIVCILDYVYKDLQ